MKSENCTKCGNKRDEESKKQIRSAWCTKCQKEYSKSYRDNNLKSDRIKEKEELKLQNKKRCTKCKDIKDNNEFWKSKWGYMGTKAECNLCSQEYGLKFKEYSKERDKTEKAKNTRKKWKQDNIEHRKKYERNWRKQKRAEDPFYKIKMNLSSRISDIIRGKISRIRTMELLGCSREEFIEYIEKQFTEGMNWNNYGKTGWQVDHIKPVSKFNLLDENEMRICWHFTNLQPLWWYDNLKKFNN